MRRPTPVPGSFLATALVVGALLGGGLLAGCQRQESQPGSQATAPTAQASPPAAPQAAPSPAAGASPAGGPPGAAAQASPAGGAPGATAQASPAGAVPGEARPAGGAAGTGPAGGATGTAPAPATPASIEAGKQLFMQNCAACHGNEGKGNGPAAAALEPKPADLTDTQWKQGGSPQEVFKTISSGVPGTAMVSWASIPEKDRWNLVNYVLSLPAKK